MAKPKKNTKRAKPAKAEKPAKKPSRKSSARKTQTRALEPRRVNSGGSHAPPQLPGRGAAARVTVANDAEALFYFGRIDERLAEAWKRDVVLPEGPITIHRVVGYFFDSTHYAYVDQRLIWYLRRDPSDPLGVKWEGYLRSASDAPRGSIVTFVGSDIVVKKCPPQLTDGRS